MKTYSSTSKALRDADSLGMGERISICGRIFENTRLGLRLVVAVATQVISRPADGRGYRNSRYGVNVQKDVDHE